MSSMSFRKRVVVPIIFILIVFIHMVWISRYPSKIEPKRTGYSVLGGGSALVRVGKEAEKKVLPIFEKIGISPSPPKATNIVAKPLSFVSTALGTCLLIQPTSGSGFENVQLGMVVPKNISDTYRVFFCPSKDTVLRGVFRVEKTRECDAQRSFLFDSEIEKELRARFGPDELTVELEGPEIIWLYQQFEGVHVNTCLYSFTYRVGTPGIYRLVAFSYRSSFESLNERQSPFYFPPINYDDLVGESAWIDLRPKQGDTGINNLNTQRKSCAGLSAPGRWVHTTGSNIFKDVPVRHKARPRGTGRPWFVNPREFEWRPYDCDLHHFTQAEAGQCLAGRKIQFRGDSHTRILFNHFTHVACGKRTTAECIAPSSNSVSPAGLCNATKMCRVFDTVGKGEMADKGKVVGHGPDSVRFTGYKGGWDTLVVNFGHHQSSALYRMLQHDFRNNTDAYFDALLRRFNQTSSNLVFWSSVPAITQRNDNIIAQADWRTLHRIQSFNEYVRNKLQGTPYIFLDLHAAALSFRDALMCEDNAHYDDAYIQYTFAQLLLNTLCTLKPRIQRSTSPRGLGFAAKISRETPAKGSS